jgi:GWxTD domain-containing protein
MRPLCLAVAFSTCAASVAGQTSAQCSRDLHWIVQEAPRGLSSEERERLAVAVNDTAQCRFVERYWEVRDPDPATSTNELREEHDERMERVERELGTAEQPGWKTDRGRLFLLYGPPDERTIGPQLPGGGGGFGEAYPWELWLYRNFQGGAEQYFELVDPTLSGYRLTTPWEQMPAALRLMPRRP